MRALTTIVASLIFALDVADTGSAWMWPIFDMESKRYDVREHATKIFLSSVQIGSRPRYSCVLSRKQMAKDEILAWRHCVKYSRRWPVRK